MLKRKIHNHLIEWKNRGDKKVLIITGARQVGKTTAIREFAKENYTHFVEVNFVKHPVAKQAFDADLDTNTIVTYLSALTKFKSAPMLAPPQSFWWKTIDSITSSQVHCSTLTIKMSRRILWALRKKSGFTLSTSRSFCGLRASEKMWWRCCENATIRKRLCQISFTSR